GTDDGVHPGVEQGVDVGLGDGRQGEVDGDVGASGEGGDVVVPLEAGDEGEVGGQLDGAADGAAHPSVGPQHGNLDRVGHGGELYWRPPGAGGAAQWVVSGAVRARSSPATSCSKGPTTTRERGRAASSAASCWTSTAVTCRIRSRLSASGMISPYTISARPSRDMRDPESSSPRTRLPQSWPIARSSSSAGSGCSAMRSSSRPSSVTTSGVFSGAQPA